MTPIDLKNQENVKLEIPGYHIEEDIQNRKNAELAELDYYIVNQQDFNRLINKNTIFKIFAASAPSKSNESYLDLSFGMNIKKTEKYHFTFDTDVTEKMVGISNDDNTVYNITWELLREDFLPRNKKKNLIFCGWGDIVNNTEQFNLYEIGIEKSLFSDLIADLMSDAPAYFSVTQIKNVIGLEGFIFENGKIEIDNGEALFVVGQMYENGINGYPEDSNKANDYYFEASEQGNMNAKTRLREIERMMVEQWKQARDVEKLKEEGFSNSEIATRLEIPEEIIEEIIRDWEIEDDMPF